MHWRLPLFGGDFAAAEGREEIVLRDVSSGVYKWLVLKDDKLIGAILYGDTVDGSWFFDMVKAGIDTQHIRSTMIFGSCPWRGTALAPYGGRRSLAGLIVSLPQRSALPVPIAELVWGSGDAAAGWFRADRRRPRSPRQLREALHEGLGCFGETLSYDGRLLYPEIAGERTSWDAALDTVAQTFRATIAEYGPDFVASTARASSSPRTIMSPTS